MQQLRDTGTLAADPSCAPRERKALRPSGPDKAPPVEATRWFCRLGRQLQLEPRTQAVQRGGGRPQWKICSEPPSHTAGPGSIIHTGCNGWQGEAAAHCDRWAPWEEGRMSPASLQGGDWPQQSAPSAQRGSHKGRSLIRGVGGVS